MVLGAAGNFGSKIASSLAKANIPLILAGRTKESLQLLEGNIKSIYPSADINSMDFDINKDFASRVEKLKPFIVINTCGPFQNADYSVARACINFGIHYVDLADSRNYVGGFTETLNGLAKERNCVAITGASTVPCLSSAVLEHYKGEFSALDSLVFGISPGQQTERGLATTKAILSYVGKTLAPSIGASTTYGWQDLYKQIYPVIGARWMANCEVPDLDLLPEHYGLQFIRFSAGMESRILHFGIFLLSWLVRLGVIKNLADYASPLLKLSRLFDYFGTADGGMHMIISGKDKNNRPKTIKWFIIARNGHGPHIPTVPAIIVAKKLVQNKLKFKGAMPCLGFITLEEYLAELEEYDVEVYVV
jgi:Saccharopine dehydrogenase NADP binding domain